MFVWMPYTGPMAQELTPEQQDALIAQGIIALASVCDGALTKDMQGFNGVDTHFGRRVALEDPANWDQDVRDECAHIILKYREQVKALTGVDVATLSRVIEAQDWGTNYAARNQARRYEKLDAARQARKVDVVTHPSTGKSCLGIFYAKKDPDFQLFLAACQALPGRKFDWDHKCNAVFVSDEAQAFIQEHDFQVSDAARALLEAPRQAPAVKCHVTLQGNRVVIDTPYDPTLVEAVRSLPGRSWDAANKVNTVNVDPQVLTFAARFNLNVDPAVVAACDRANQALKARAAEDLAAKDVATILNHVSRAKSPEDVPPVFVAMFNSLGQRSR